MPLSGFVDNDGALHLSGRDFDDNMTYQFLIDSKTHEINSEIIDGITLGNGTIGENTDFSVYEYDLYNPEETEILTPEQMADILENKYDLIKVNVYMGNPGSYDPGSYDSGSGEGSYDPSNSKMTMNFNKTQYVSGIEGQNIEILTYASGVSFENSITVLDVINEFGRYSYEMRDLEIGGSGPSGEIIECNQLRVNESASFNDINIYGNATISHEHINYNFYNDFQIHADADNYNTQLFYSLNPTACYYDFINKQQGTECYYVVQSGEMRYNSFHQTDGTTDSSMNITYTCGGNGSHPAMHFSSEEIINHTEVEEPYTERKQSGLQFFDGALQISHSSTTDFSAESSITLDDTTLTRSELIDIKNRTALTFKLSIHTAHAPSESGSVLFKHYAFEGTELAQLDQTKPFVVNSATSGSDKIMSAVWDESRTGIYYLVWANGGIDDDFDL